MRVGDAAALGPRVGRSGGEGARTIAGSRSRSPQRARRRAARRARDRVARRARRAPRAARRPRRGSCKAPWTAAGRDRAHGAGPRIDRRAAGRDLRRMLERLGALVFEPWLDRVARLRRVRAASRDGRVNVAARRTRCSPTRAAGSSASTSTPPPLDRDEHARCSTHAIAGVGAALARAGYARAVHDRRVRVSRRRRAPAPPAVRAQRAPHVRPRRARAAHAARRTRARLRSAAPKAPASSSTIRSRRRGSTTDLRQFDPDRARARPGRHGRPTTTSLIDAGECSSCSTKINARAPATAATAATAATRTTRPKRPRWWAAAAGWPFRRAAGAAPTAASIDRQYRSVAQIRRGQARYHRARAPEGTTRTARPRWWAAAAGWPFKGRGAAPTAASVEAALTRQPPSTT